MISIALLLHHYLDAHPDQAPRLARLQGLVAENQAPEWLIDRKNFEGHVTASGFVVNRRRGMVVLVYHKGLAIHVQPGGHLERTDATPLDGARREVREETGITNITLLPLDTDPLVPFDIDSHFIPANPAKGESEHWHHDFRYVFLCDDQPNAAANPEEVSDLQWVSLDQLDLFPTFDAVAPKLRQFVRRAGVQTT